MKYKQSNRYENDFIRRLKKYGSINDVIKSFTSPHNEGTNGRTKFLKERRLKFQSYLNSHKDFKNIINEILEFSENKKNQPKTKNLSTRGYKIEYDEIVCNLRRCGMDSSSISKYLNVDKKTLIEWRKQNKTFGDAWEKVKTDDFVKTSNAVQETSMFYKTTTVRTEEGFIDIKGESVPINKTITTVTDHPPIMASVRMKLAQYNNSIGNSNKNLLGYVPPENVVTEKPIDININLKGSDDEFSLNDTEDDSTSSENKEEKEKG